MVNQQNVFNPAKNENCTQIKPFIMIAGMVEYSLQNTR